MRIARIDIPPELEQQLEFNPQNPQPTFLGYNSSLKTAFRKGALGERVYGLTQDIVILSNKNLETKHLDESVCVKLIKNILNKVGLIL